MAFPPLWLREIFKRVARNWPPRRASRKATPYLNGLDKEAWLMEAAVDEFTVNSDQSTSHFLSRQLSDGDIRRSQMPHVWSLASDKVSHLRHKCPSGSGFQSLQHRTKDRATALWDPGLPPAVQHQSLDPDSQIPQGPHTMGHKTQISMILSARYGPRKRQLADLTALDTQHQTIHQTETPGDSISEVRHTKWAEMKFEYRPTCILAAP